MHNGRFVTVEIFHQSANISNYAMYFLHWNNPWPIHEFGKSAFRDFPLIAFIYHTSLSIMALDRQLRQTRNHKNIGDALVLLGDKIAKNELANSIVKN